MLIPALAYWRADEIVDVVFHEVGSNTDDFRFRDGAVTARVRAGGAAVSRRWDWRAMLMRIDRPLAIAWIGSTVAVTFYFLIGFVMLARVREVAAFDIARR